MEMLRSAAPSDVQIIADALIAVIDSLPNGDERVQLYQTMVQEALAGIRVLKAYTREDAEARAIRRGKRSLPPAQP